MSIVTEPRPLDREQWKRDRLRGLGASEWTTVLGVNPNKSRFELACEKLGEIVPEDLDDREDIEFGHALEPVSLAFLAKRTGRKVQQWPQDQIVVSPSHDFLFATPDGMQFDPVRGEGVAETKNRCEWVAREWKEQPPLLVQVQIQAQMFCANKTWGTICAILGGNRFRYFDVERDDEFLATAIPVLEAFWRNLQSGIKPDFDGTESCKQSIAKLYPKDRGTAIDLPADFDAKFAELSALKRCQSLLSNRRELLENEIKLAIGDNTEGLLATGARFSWKQQSRTETCPHCQAIIRESSFRVLRQHKAKGATAEIMIEARATATAALLASGAQMLDESPAGSRYFETAGGLLVRLSDHKPNKKTNAWMDRREVASIRVDQPEWREQLEAVVGPLQLEG